MMEAAKHPSHSVDDATRKLQSPLHTTALTLLELSAAKRSSGGASKLHLVARDEITVSHNLRRA